MYQFHSHKSRLLVFIICLLGSVLGAVFIAVNKANISNARLHIDEALDITVSTFLKSLELRQATLEEFAKILSSDYAFKSAYATHDKDTITSMLENHQMRAGANMMLLLSMEGLIITHTIKNKSKLDPTSFETLMSKAMQSPFGQTSAIQIIDNKAYQVVVVPLYAPDVVAWVLVGYLVDDRFVKEQREFTHSEVSLLYRSDKKSWKLFASTFNQERRNEVQRYVNNEKLNQSNTRDLSLSGKIFLTRTLNIQRGDVGETLVVLQRRLDTAFAPYARLQKVMLFLFGLGLIISVVVAIGISKGVSRPVEQLVNGVRRIEAGNYDSDVVINRKDEIGKLAISFNKMAKGLKERDHVRNLLGKVVSPQIAEELLSRDIELGGEEKEITIMFSDIRDFTGLCENRSPQEILSFLNRYLTTMSDVIEKHDGVIDQYMGDGIMALYGAPLALENSSQNAVCSALDMIGGLRKLNVEQENEGSPKIRFGVGINTSKVWVGNMGSHDRLNYSVIGDGVNLTSRIEGLTKRYQVEVIVTESTCKLCNKITFRELDRVRVKGRVTPVAIYEPLGLTSALSSEARDLLKMHDAALSCFRARRWDDAEDLFREIIKEQGENTYLYDLYLSRVRAFRRNPPAAEWDSTVTFEEK